MYAKQNNLGLLKKAWPSKVELKVLCGTQDTYLIRARAVDKWLGKKYIVKNKDCYQVKANWIGKVTQGLIQEQIYVHANLFKLSLGCF